ncbi:hypothetical protein CL657_05955 [bacterium]|nr:hypothetical protein [bacterium]
MMPMKDLQLHNKQRSSSNKLAAFLQNNSFNNLLVLGTWALGGSHFGLYDTKEAYRVIAFAYEHGIRQFDCAEFYAKGQSQHILYKALQVYDPSSYLVFLKAGLKWQGNRVIHDASHRHICDTVDKARDIFKKDTLDSVLLHWPDPHLDIRIACDTLSQLKEAGHIMFWGLCNIRHEHLNVIQGYDYDLCQFHYNLVNQGDEGLMTSLGDDNKVIYSYSPFEQGLLVNPLYSQSYLFSKKDVRNRNPCFFDAEIKKKLEGLFSLDTAGFSYTNCLLYWLLEKSFLDSVIVGARYVNHMHDICKILTLSKSEQERLSSSLFYRALDSF